MRILTLKVGERVRIAGHTTVEVVGIHGRTVRFQIESTAAITSVDRVASPHERRPSEPAPEV